MADLINPSDKKLVIVMQGEDSVPMLYLNGERQPGLVLIDFNYRTAKERHIGVTHFKTEYATSKEEILTRTEGFTRGLLENLDQK